MTWRDEPWHWLHQIDAAISSVALEFAQEYLDGIQDLEDDGTPYEESGPEEIVQSALQHQEFWIEARLTGLDPSALRPGVSSSDVTPREGIFGLMVMEDWMDIALIRAFLNGLDEMRKRLFIIPVIVLAQELPSEVRVYTVQATRCFALGLGEAGAVLARTALEKALEDRLGHPGLLRDLVPEADSTGLLTQSEIQAARKIQDIGNRAAHGRVLAPTEAELSVTEIRRLVARLYPTSATSA